VWNTIAYAKCDAKRDADSHTKRDAKCNSIGNSVGDTVSYAEPIGYAERESDALSDSHCYTYAYT
jgi:hypothetical protein